MLQKVTVSKCRKDLNNIMRSQLESFPFHNLGQLLGKKTPNGGTCFDHALKLRSKVKSLGIPATLHEAEVCLTGNLSHRLVRIETAGEVSFLDTGTGWPTVYEASLGQKLEEFEIASMRFRVISESNSVLVKRHDGLVWRDMNRIPLNLQNEESILKKFQERYRQPLPYSNELRISWLKGCRFYRISGANLTLFETGKAPQKSQLNSSELVNCVGSDFPEMIPDLTDYLKSVS